MAKVLIVDDEPTTRFMLRRFVHDLGHTVIESSNGRRGWDVLWDNRDIDLLITDLLMPELTGEGLIQMVRASVELRKLPILVITGNTEADELKYLVELGASGFARKPITPAVKAVIQRVLLPGDLPEATKLQA
ncbi:MAG: Protein with response regulator receiver domain [Myxococcaceae bacterium]|nr:Protein with response regulator receiver domain [Myxococcaceae bacterium]